MDGYQPSPEEWLQEAAALLARAFRDLEEILAMIDAAAGELIVGPDPPLIVGPDPPWAQILPQPPPAAKFNVRMIRVEQRNVKAIGQLGTVKREHSMKLHQSGPGGSGPFFLKNMDGRCLRRAQPQAQRQVVRFDSHAVLQRARGQPPMLF